ncbi:MAG: Crp/Fnr family transcriptional regulator [Marinifilaceae bacterium]|jgi:CRP-like cAMP-binding protein|nr:Crp/Fnr family transcriptional regulator [Marinifilaceae bacterium]
MYDQIIQILSSNPSEWNEYKNFFKTEFFPKKTLLLREGNIAERLFFIQKGLVRKFFNKDGKDISLQFFFENQQVSCIESLIKSEPSKYSIETLEDSNIIIINKKEFEFLIENNLELKDLVFKFGMDRLINYSQLFLSRIKDSPQERYNNLITEQPEILKRVAQHYIASYLGITSVSLSRIRNRK